MVNLPKSQPEHKMTKTFLASCQFLLVSLINADQQLKISIPHVLDAVTKCS